MTEVDRTGHPRRFDRDLADALGRIARVPHLLIGCDYDGTLAPLADDPSKAEPLIEAVAAIRALASLPQTTVAVVSSRESVARSRSERPETTATVVWGREARERIAATASVRGSAFEGSSTRGASVPS